MVPLESSKLFLGLPIPKEVDLCHVAEEKRFEAGTVIFKEGELGDGMYIIKEGAVEIASSPGKGERRQLSQFGPGDHFGEMAILDEDPRSATATTIEPSVIYFIERKAFYDLLHRMPALAVRLFREISRRLRDFNHQYVREVLDAERLTLVGRFASSIVHDIKGPLNVISLSAEMAAMHNATPQAREVCTTRVRKQVERITNMVNELLEFARGSNTHFVLARLDYAQFIEQFVEETRAEVKPRGIQLELENQPPALMVQIDPQRLARVLHNFITNASDAMPSGGPVFLRFESKDNELVTEVRDSGQGIAPEVLDRLFQPFATFGKANGTGLGLSICKKIISDHRGRVFGRNAPQGGAVFGFALPITLS